VERQDLFGQSPARFYDVGRARFSSDGHDIRKVTFKSLRDQIALVTQQTILFNDTIRNNIAYGNIHCCSDQEIIEAAKAAYAHDFIIKLPEGYDTLIGEQGVKLSVENVSASPLPEPF